MLLDLLLVDVSYAESSLTGNVGVTSNYIWRGATQGSDDSAVSGGIYYAHDSGLYVGTWVSSLSGGSSMSRICTLVLVVRQDQ